LSPCF